ncbi:MAG TPA: glycine zipper 2TM domain-containing protein [Armatimonadota bacterium]|nr:glycine zipper 2TM domain-containing protein [Armatimonadota bacterium]
MHTNKQSGRIHPLMAGAAVSVMLVSLVGTAAITGILPTSHGTNVPAPVAASAALAPAGSVASTLAAALAPLISADDSEPQRVVHHHHVAHHTTTVQAQPSQYAAQAPVYPQPPQPAPVAQNSPLGIGVGAVVGGLLGSQVGGGRGRTLSTIAGAVGGGYVGNEIAKRNQ